MVPGAGCWKDPEGRKRAVPGDGLDTEVREGEFSRVTPRLWLMQGDATVVGRTAGGSGWGNHEFDSNSLHWRNVCEAQVEMW